MEEGPEPHEFVERSVEHQHHEEEEHAHPAPEVRRDTVLYAVTAAVLAVLAALGSLLSGHEANQAILHQSKATDQWAYFQSKSTKGQVYEMGKELIQALSEAQGTTDKTSPALARFRERIDKYEKEKEEPQQEARRLEEESELEFKKHHHFALAVAAFQVGIVLASISIMVRYRWLWVLSLLAGSSGLALLVKALTF
jgi:hypothetical protein